MLWPTPPVWPTLLSGSDQGPARHSSSVNLSHHSSRTFSSEASVPAIQLCVAVFSVHRGIRFGHPHPAVFERYKALDVHIFRTDRHGAIAFKVDGCSLQDVLSVSLPAEV